MQIEFTPKDIERFWSYVDQSGGHDACWPWTRSRHAKGYGQFTVIRGGKTYNNRTNRLAFFFTHGHWPNPLACHTCDNPPCCNPAHIYAGSAKENTADMMARTGHNRPHAAFSDDQIREIRHRRQSGEELKAIAADHGVTPGCICAITLGRSYRHVA